MKVVSFAHLSAVSLLILGCTKGAPGFTTLDSSVLPQPLFSGAKEEALVASSSTETLLISGDCDSRITDIKGSAEGTASTFSTLSDMAVSSVSITCSSDGHFSFTLKSLTDLGYTPVNNTIYNIDLRGVSTGGISNASVVHITYASGAGPDPKHILLTGGSTTSSSSARLASGANYAATIRVGSRIPASTDPSVADAMTTIKGTHYQIKMGPAAQ